MDKLTWVAVVVALTAGAMGTSWAEEAQKLEALPELASGIAAKYAGDEGIEKDAEVVFADDFEESVMGAGAKWDTSWNDENRLFLEKDARKVHSGKQAAALTMRRENPRMPEGCDMVKLLGTGYDRLFVRYYMKFEKGGELFHGGAHNGVSLDARGPDIYKPSPGIKATGTNKFTVLLDTWRPRRWLASPGWLVVYVYHPEQRPRFGEQWFPSGRVNPPGKEEKEMFGERFVARKEFVPKQDRWYCFELMVQANTPGKRNGRIAYWVDGKLTADFPNLRLRDVPSLKLNRLSLHIFSKNRRTSTPVKIWYDDVVVAKSYVGPMSRAKEGGR